MANDNKNQADHIELYEQESLLREKAPTEERFRTSHNYSPPTAPSLASRVKQKISSETVIAELLPCLSWMKNYNFKVYLIADFIAGLTVSVMQIPHGLAFAPLGGQPPVVGLYMGFFPPLLYVIFGTSRHISLGMFAILSMMVGKVVFTYAPVVPLAENSTSPYSALEVGIAVSFLVGLWQLLFGLLQLGSLCVLLSNCVVSGFTSAAAVHVFFIQLKHILKLPLKSISGPFKLIYLADDIASKIPQVDIPTLIISLSVMTILMCFNELLKPLIMKKTSIPIPIEFTLIILSIIACRGFKLNDKYGIAIVGPVPSGLPELIAPPMSIMPMLLWDCLVIAAVNTTVNISLASIFAKKGEYNIQGSQELRAYGLCNIFGSFFHCLPVCASISRSSVQYSVGGKTQVATVFSCLSVLLIILYVGSFFEDIPLCVLASIVTVTLKGLLIQIKDFPKIWKTSRREGKIWLVTFISVLLFDVDYGIAVGVLFSVGNLLIIGTEAEVVIMGEAAQGNVYLNLNYYKLDKAISEFFLMQIMGPLTYANSDKITETVFNNIKASNNNNSVRYVIINFSAVPYIDPSFILTFSAAFKECKGEDYELYLTNCFHLYSTFERCNFFESFPKDHVLVDIDNAVKYLRDNRL